MSGLFSKPSVPAPAPVPEPPIAPDSTGNKEAEARRLEAERAALAESKMRGRASTIAGGGVSMELAQMARGQEMQTGRLARRELLG